MKRKILIDRNFPNSDEIRKRQNFSRINADYSLIKNVRNTRFFGLKLAIGIAIVLGVGFFYWNKKTTPVTTNLEASNKSAEIVVANPPTVPPAAVAPPVDTKSAAAFKADTLRHVIATNGELKNKKKKETEKRAPIKPSAEIPITPAVATKNQEEIKVQEQSLPVKEIIAPAKDSVETSGKKPLELAENKTDPDKMVYNTSTIEVQPEFPGGHPALMKFLNDNLVYPEAEMGNNIQGKTYVSFIIDKYGRVTNVQVVKGIPQGEKLDKEAVRVVKMMPYWKPGKQNGKPVKVQYMLPVQFKTVQ